MLLRNVLCHGALYLKCWHGMAGLNESGVKHLLEHLQGDFKAISGEAKKKLPAVKEVKQLLTMGRSGIV